MRTKYNMRGIGNRFRAATTKCTYTCIERKSNIIGCAADLAYMPKYTCLFLAHIIGIGSIEMFLRKSETTCSCN